MKADATTIWSVPAYLPYLQPELTNEIIAHAEAKIGFKLPAAYLHLLRSQNGGYIRFGLPESPHDTIYGIGPNYPSITDSNLSEAQEYVTMELIGLVPFDGDGHWHVCLDYRKNNLSPSVAWVDVECDREYTIAPTFSDYVQLLTCDANDNDFFVPHCPDIDALTTVVGTRLGVSFGTPNSNDYGYPQYRACIPDPGGPEWIWISPNMVPRGFVRERDKRYDELRDWMPGKALRYPMLPSDSLIVQCTDKVRPSIVDRFRNAAFELRPIKALLTN